MNSAYIYGTLVVFWIASSPRLRPWPTLSWPCTKVSLFTDYVLYLSKTNSKNSKRYFGFKQRPVEGPNVLCLLVSVEKFSWYYILYCHIVCCIVLKQRGNEVSFYLYNTYCRYIYCRYILDYCTCAFLTKQSYNLFITRYAKLKWAA